MWIFGYGSLMWRPSFEFVESQPARVRGWSRRFWQGSTDHRGTHEKPGRVVTLIEEADAVCWGRAFRLDPSASGPILAQLDDREKGGYRRQTVMIELPDAVGVEGLLYVADQTNPNYLGPADVSDIADQIRSAEGPSGSNIEYLRRLNAALQELGADDSHVVAVLAHV